MKITYKIPESKKDITLEQYLKIQKLYSETGEGEIVDDFDLMSVYLNMPKEIIKLFPKSEYDEALSSISRISKELENGENEFLLTFKHNGIIYGFIPDLENITIGEYAALDQFFKDADNNAYNIINVLYRPIVKEKTYKSWFNKKERKRYLISDYDSKKDVSVFKDVPYTIYQSALIFFYNLGTSLLADTLSYTKEELEKKQNKEPTTSGKNGDGIKHLIHTLNQNELEYKKYTKNLQIKYSID